jgi:DNA replicative helicase MCM subunit Mcm2 (Cdc46/Mcm family)
MGILDGSEFDELMRMQRQMASSIVNDFEIDNKVKILNIIEEVAGKKKKVQTEKILQEAEAQGMMESDALSILEKLKKEGMVFEPQPGYLQKY